MFATHQPEIAEIARSSSEGFFSVVLMAMVSANIPFHKVGVAMEDTQREGSTSKWLRGSKREGYAALKEQQESLWVEYTTVWDFDPIGYSEVALLRLLEIPGLGLVKAGFSVQLLLGQLGCLDVHNQALYGISPELTRARKHLPHLLPRKVQKYSEVVNRYGSEFLWDSWCIHMAKTYPKHFLSGEAVSAYHIEITGRGTDGRK